jgi:hypothetical protein
MSVLSPLYEEGDLSLHDFIWRGLRAYLLLGDSDSGPFTLPTVPTQMVRNFDDAETKLKAAKALPDEEWFKLWQADIMQETHRFENEKRVAQATAVLHDGVEAWEAPAKLGEFRVFLLSCADRTPPSFKCPQTFEAFKAFNLQKMEDETQRLKKVLDVYVRQVNFKMEVITEVLKIYGPPKEGICSDLDTP